MKVQSIRFLQEGSRRGFSLIELSIVVAILSVIATMGLEVAANFVNRSAYTTTAKTMASADSALKEFFKIYGRLPCPANRVLGTTNANYGLEDCTLSTLGTSTIGGGVLGGAFPFRTLNLAITSSMDGFSNKLNYLVTKNLTVAGGSSSDGGKFASTTAVIDNNSGVGGIEVRSGRLEQPCNTTVCSVAANPAAGTGAAYAIFSNGSDRRGAVNRDGIAGNSCTPDPVGNYRTRIDTQNCAIWGGIPVRTADDSTVLAIPLNVVYDSRFNNGSSRENYFDDIILWHTKSQL